MTKIYLGKLIIKIKKTVMFKLLEKQILDIGKIFNLQI